MGGSSIKSLHERDCPLLSSISQGPKGHQDTPPSRLVVFSLPTQRKHPKKHPKKHDVGLSTADKPQQPRWKGSFLFSLRQHPKRTTQKKTTTRTSWNVPPCFEVNMFTCSKRKEQLHVIREFPQSFFRSNRSLASRSRAFPGLR